MMIENAIAGMNCVRSRDLGRGTARWQPVVEWPQSAFGVSVVTLPILFYWRRISRCRKNTSIRPQTTSTLKKHSQQRYLSCTQNIFATKRSATERTAEDMQTRLNVELNIQELNSLCTRVFVRAVAFKTLGPS